MTIKRFRGILRRLGLTPSYYKEVPLRPWLTPLAKLPGLKEMFVKMGVCAAQGRVTAPARVYPLGLNQRNKCKNFLLQTLFLLAFHFFV